MKFAEITSLSGAPTEYKTAMAAVHPRRCSCPRVIRDNGKNYVLQVAHDPSCRHYGRHT
jgi:hypothetical protein